MSYLDPSLLRRQGNITDNLLVKIHQELKNDRKCTHYQYIHAVIVMIYTGCVFKQLFLVDRYGTSVSQMTTDMLYFS